MTNSALLQPPKQLATGNKTAVQRLERNATGVDSYVTAETATYDNYREFQTHLKVRLGPEVTTSTKGGKHA